MTVQQGTSHVMAEEQPSSPAAKEHDVWEAVVDVRTHLALVKPLVQIPALSVTSCVAWVWAAESVCLGLLVCKAGRAAAVLVRWVGSVKRTAAWPHWVHCRLHSSLSQRSAQSLLLPGQDKKGGKSLEFPPVLGKKAGRAVPGGARSQQRQHESCLMQGPGV